MDSLYFPKKNTKVWFKLSKDSGLPYQVGTFLRKDPGTGKATIEVKIGETTLVPMELLKSIPSKIEEVEDLLQLQDFSENSLIESLDARYQRDEFYTYCGPILVSINPYKWADIYSEKFILKYKGKHKKENPPHLYYIAQKAYENLVKAEGPENQAIIISGESGAGKTEATKILLRYLTQVTSSKGETKLQEENTGSLEEKLINSNPLLESFGNAQTIRNNNSSRFGKFLEIHFCKRGKIAGAKVVNYLLEKTRIVRQSEGERNYHIFYQILNGAPDNTLKELGLNTISNYNYLSGGYDATPDKDRENFKQTVRCMTSILFNNVEETIRLIFSTLAAVLHIGNIEFDPCNDDGSCMIKPGNQSVFWISQLLGVSTESLQEALCFTVVYVNGECIMKPVELEKSISKRDALGKVLYSLLFRWLVTQLNKIIQSDVPRIGFIGVLDIYGFECFKVNSFEQFCINFANEKLQRLFNKHIFEVEQELYESEGIDWSHIEFRDNQKCLDLIEDSPLSLLSLLDEECLMPRGSDGSLLQKLHGNHRDKNAHYCCPRFNGDSQFGVKHYAGTVFYNVEGFLQKNAESLSEDLSALIKSSTSGWFQELFFCCSTNSDKKRNSQKLRRRSSSLRPPTISQQFRKQLHSLNERLDLCRPHYVRCIKPNDLKTPNNLSVTRTLEQLKYAGMLEAIRIRQQGYALRTSHERFFQQYKTLAPSSTSCRELLQVLSNAFGLDNRAWQIGYSKVFLKSGITDFLQIVMTIRIKTSKRKILKVFRSYRSRKRYKAAVTIQAYFTRAYFKTLKKSTIRIQSWYRMVACQKQYMQKLKEREDMRQCETLEKQTIHQEIENRTKGSNLAPIAKSEEYKTSASKNTEWALIEEMKKENDKLKKELRQAEKLKEEKQELEARLKHSQKQNELFTEREKLTTNRLRKLRSRLESISGSSNVSGAKQGTEIENEFYCLEGTTDNAIQEVYQLKQELKSNVTPEQASSLMKENIALMDEMVDIRTRFESLRIRLENTLMRAKQAEYANDTLCTILAWRDKQIDLIKRRTIFQDCSDVYEEKETQRIENAIKSLTPYFNRISTQYENENPAHYENEYKL